MSEAACPTDEQLAAAVAGEADDAVAHAASCARCAAALELDRELIAHARAIPVAPLSPARRMALAAETLARAEHGGHRGTRIAVTAGLALAAGFALIVLATHEPASPSHALAETTSPATSQTGFASERSSEPIESTNEPLVPSVEPPNRPAMVPRRLRPASIASSDGEFDRARVHERDTIQLRDGTLVVDARGRAPVSVVVGGATIAVDDSRAKLVVVGGVLVVVHAFAGSVEIVAAEQHAKVVTGGTWTPPATPTTSLEAFRAGWQALRAERYADAIAAFDVATDPVVAEDAAFWAAIAASRAGRDSDARHRFEAFLVRFPDSTRADDARAALAAQPQ